MKCLLCHHTDVSVYYKSKKASFYECSSCQVVFRNPEELLALEAEKQRYLLHNEDASDIGYRASVLPLVNTINKQFPLSAKGLDYGAGTSAIVAKMLTEKGFQMQLWDPFFHPNTNVFDQTYSFISCSETIEHFHHPLQEFQRMYDALEPKGILFCKTELLPEKEKFKDWYYKNDITHVSFFSKASLEWVQKQIGFTTLAIYGNVIVFGK